MPAGVVAHEPNHLACNGLGIAERHRHSTVFGQQFGSVPVGCGNYCFASTKCVGQCARCDLGFAEVRSDVKVCRADELLQVVKLYELVVEDDVLFEFVLLGKDLEVKPVGFSMVAQFVRMGSAQEGSVMLTERRRRRSVRSSPTRHHAGTPMQLRESENGAGLSGFVAPDNSKVL
jgi:hypothetical protein